jgi:hypothetical protein
MFVMVINLYILFKLYIVCDICKMFCAIVCVTFNCVVVCVNKLLLLLRFTSRHSAYSVDCRCISGFCIRSVSDRQPEKVARRPKYIVDR